MISPEKFPLEKKEKEKPSFFRDPLIEKLEKAGLEAEIIKEIEERLTDSLTGLPRSEIAKAAINQLIKEGEMSS